jgi:hypothetical protein
MSHIKLHSLQRDTFDYFLKESNPSNGLIPDNTRKGAPVSIAVMGLALAAFPIGVERRFLSRVEAIKRTLTILRDFWNSPQGEQPDARGYKCFYYHFLDIQTGRRTWNCELSTIDTTFLLAGGLTCAMYFDRDTTEEREIRSLADALYRRADWQWALNGGPTVSMGWKPGSGFLRFRWEGYSEALLLYVLGLGSPTYPLPEESYGAWTESYRWKKLYGYEFLFAGSLFIHQLSHLWIDFRGIQDRFMRQHGIDYFENSRRATYIQRQYAIRNPRHFDGYNEYCWGITASDSPGPATRRIKGIKRRFFDYVARKVPQGPDDGTIAPWAAAASLPFAPEIVLSALQHISEVYPEMTSKYGFKCSFNPTFRDRKQSKRGWVSKGYFGLDQGPIVIMVENYRSELIWQLMRHCSYIVRGLRRAGFKDGWL